MYVLLDKQQVIICIPPVFTLNTTYHLKKNPGCSHASIVSKVPLFYSQYFNAVSDVPIIDYNRKSVGLGC